MAKTGGRRLSEKHTVAHGGPEDVGFVRDEPPSPRSHLPVSRGPITQSAAAEQTTLDPSPAAGGAALFVMYN